MEQAMISRRELMVGTASLAATYAIGKVVYAEGKKVLRAWQKADIGVLDPAFSGATAERETMFATLPRLARIEKDGENFVWVPTDYVESLEQTDDLRIPFTLKPGFHWTNGFGELTAEDVKYSFERMKESQWKDEWRPLDHVEVTGTYTGTIVLQYPFPPLFMAVLAGGMGCIVSKKATESVGGQYTMKMPSSCGPYVIQELIPKQRTVLAANADWAGEKPDFDEVQFIIITDLNAAELAFEAREIDIARVTPIGLRRYREDMPADAKITVAGYLNHGWLGMNTEHPKLSDIRVRKAIQHALDVDAALEAGFSGAAVKAHGVVPPNVVGKRNVTTGYHYDPEKARALLREAGVTSLQLELKTTNFPERVNMAQVFQANLAEVGIDIKVIPYDVGTFWNQGREKKGDEWKDLQIYITRFGAGIDPTGSLNWFVKDQIGNWNWERWSDPEFEELFRKLASEADPDKRAKMAIRMQEIMEKTGAYVWLQHEPEAFIHRTSVDPSITPGGDQEFAAFQSS